MLAHNIYMYATHVAAVGFASALRFTVWCQKWEYRPVRRILDRGVSIRDHVLQDRRQRWVLGVL